MFERVLEQVPRAKELVFYCTKRKFLHRSNLFVRQLREVAELNQLAIVGRQIADCRVDRGAELFVLQRAIRRDAVVGELALFSLILVACPRDRHFGDALLAQRVDGAVLRDPEQPGRELILRVVSIEREKHFDEDLLRQIVSIFITVRDAVDVVDDAFFVARDQLREPVAVAAEDPRDEGAVIELLTFCHVSTIPPGEGFRRADDNVAAVIEIRSLTKKYGDFVAVDDLSLSVHESEVFGFLGPNGAGKTTTIRIVAGLSLPTSGSVTVGGVDVIASPVAAKAMMGYIPDRPYLYEKLTGRELLQFAANRYRRESRDCEPRAIELLHYFDLHDWIDARIENLSHGMKQKLVIVSALVHDPRVLIIDEPMVG